MKGFFAFVRKEFLHIFRDRRTLLVLVGLPVMLIVLFGFAISTEIRNVNIGVCVPDQDITVTRLVDKIDRSGYFTFKGWYSSSEDIDEAMRRGDIDAALMFGRDFSSSMLDADGADVSIVTDAVNPNNASMEVMYLTNIIYGYFREDIQSYPGGTPVVPNLRMLYNPQLVSIVKEKETGTMEVLLVSPVKPIGIVFAKMIPYFVISCAVLIITLLLTIFVLKVPVEGSFFWMILVSMLYIILSLGIGLLVSSIVKTQIIATLIIGMVFLVPVMMMSGMLYPIESMPYVFQLIAQVIPAKWYIEAIRKIMIEGVPFVFVLKETGVLLAMTVVIFTAAVKKFNDRIE